MSSKTKFSFILISCCAFLYGCGGGSSSNAVIPANDESELPPVDEPPVIVEPTVLTGVFAVSAAAAEGINFNTGTQSGTTNAAGEFQYIEDETVVLSIGALDFPPVTAAAVISPFDLSANSTDPNATASNIVRLLQSLDQDGYAYNGIKVPAVAAASSAPVNFTVSTNNFEINPIVINMVANSGSFSSGLTTLQEAMTQLFQITTAEEFEDEIVDNQLVLRRAGGGRIESSQFLFQSNGTLIRFGAGGVIDQSADLAWYWEDQFFCRFGSVGDSPRPLDCSVASLTSDGIVTFVSQRGLGDEDNWFIE